MLARTFAAAVHGIDATLVTVEAEVRSRGLPSWNMVGMLETAVKEARDRVASAIRNAGFPLPDRRTIINLAPADVRKGGAHFDLPIAVALLAAMGGCRPARAARYLFAGELGLTGEVLPTDAIFLMAEAAARNDLDGIIVPRANAEEAALAGAADVVGVERLTDVVAFLNDGARPTTAPKHVRTDEAAASVDMCEVKGQPLAKRGLLIAAAGGHNAAMRGPPGTGKTMLAERLPTILPPLARAEAIAVLKVRSWHGLLRGGSALPRERPFRAPHHTASYAGLIGGSRAGLPQLGELALAHNGVLFLDEMGEFRKDVLEVLRQPLESGQVSIVRAGVSLRYPARFLLVAAFNPCRCGWLGHPQRACSCSVNQLRAYRTKLSGPLMDRIDLHIEVAPPPHDDLLEERREISSAQLRQRVIAARKRQTERLGDAARCNAHCSGAEIAQHAQPDTAGRALLRQAAHDLALSARAVHRVLKVARTIADLEAAEGVRAEHLAEALQYRPRLDDLS